MNTVSILLQGESLVSRGTAAEYRLRLESNVGAGKLVALDFAQVSTLSPAFADELIAVLVERHGFDWLREHVRLRNISEEILDDLAAAISVRRKGEHHLSKIAK